MTDNQVAVYCPGCLMFVENGVTVMVDIYESNTGLSFWGCPHLAIASTEEK